MHAVLAALFPVFLLIVAGLLLRRFLIAEDAHWVGMERLLYYVMFPALLIGTLVRADLTKVPVLAVGGTLLAACWSMSGALLRAAPAARAPPRRRRPGLHVAVPGRDALADLRGAAGRRQHVRRSRARARLGRHGGDDAGAQCAVRVGAGALRLAGDAGLARRAARGRAEPADLVLRGRDRAQPGLAVDSAAASTSSSTRSGARRSRSAC